MLTSDPHGKRINGRLRRKRQTRSVSPQYLGCVVESTTPKKKKKKKKKSPKNRPDFGEKRPVGQEKKKEGGWARCYETRLENPTRGPHR